MNRRASQLTSLAVPKLAHDDEDDAEMEDEEDKDDRKPSMLIFHLGLVIS